MCAIDTQDIPGFLFGLLRCFLFFRRHGRFFLVFPVTFSLFRHDVLLRNVDEMIFWLTNATPGPGE